MKKFILAAMLLLSMNANAEWLEELRTKDVVLYVDWGSVRVRDHDQTVMWQAYVNALSDKELEYIDSDGAKYPYRSMMVQYHTRCITPARKTMSWHKEWAKTYNQADLKEIRADLVLHSKDHEFRTQTGFFGLNMKVCNYR